MKLQQANHFPGFARVINHVVGRQPELAKPNIQKKDCEKASEIEDIFFQRNPAAKRGSKNAQGCAAVGIVEEPLSENKIEEETQRDKKSEGPKESTPRDVQSLAR